MVRITAGGFDIIFLQKHTLAGDNVRANVCVKLQIGETDKENMNNPILEEDCKQVQIQFFFYYYLI